MSEILEPVGVFVLSGLGVVAFGYFLVRGAEDFADKYGFDRFLIGFVLLSVLTSTPELTVAAASALEKVVELSVGDILGSNVVNIAFVAAIALFITKKTFHIEAPLSKNLAQILFLSTAIPVSFVFPQIISPSAGLLFAAAFAGYVIVSYRAAPPQHLHRKPVKTSSAILLLSILLGGAGLIFSASVLVQSAKVLSELFGIAQLELGAKLVALTTSAPELVTTVTSLRRGEYLMAMGNVIGSNLTNITLIFGVLLLFSGDGISFQPHIGVLMFVVLVSITFWYFISRNKITLFDVVVLLAQYAAFLLIGR